MFKWISFLILFSLLALSSCDALLKAIENLEKSIGLPEVEEEVKKFKKLQAKTVTELEAKVQKSKDAQIEKKTAEKLATLRATDPDSTKTEDQIKAEVKKEIEDAATKITYPGTYPGTYSLAGDDAPKKKIELFVVIEPEKTNNLSAINVIVKVPPPPTNPKKPDEIQLKNIYPKLKQYFGVALGDKTYDVGLKFSGTISHFDGSFIGYLKPRNSSLGLFYQEKIVQALANDENVDTIRMELKKWTDDTAKIPAVKNTGFEFDFTGYRTDTGKKIKTVGTGTTKKE